jgi:hypothetical protein
MQHNVSSPSRLPINARPTSSSLSLSDSERFLQAQDEADETALNDAEREAEVLPPQEMLAQLENVNLLGKHFPHFV